MLVGLYIFVDDEFDDPIYADPEPDELEEGVWERICEVIHEAIDGEGDHVGTRAEGELLLGWRYSGRNGLSFVAAVTDEVSANSVEAYLKSLARRYVEEVDEVRNPEREGVADVVVDVIPEWEE